MKILDYIAYITGHNGMTLQECITGLKYLGSIFNKEFSSDDCEAYYSVLKSYNYDVYRKALKNLAMTNKFAPALSEIIDQCEILSKEFILKLISIMQDKGYFKSGGIGTKSGTEIDKTLLWVNEGIIPNFLLNDMRFFYSGINQEQIENGKEVKMING